MQSDEIDYDNDEQPEQRTPNWRRKLEDDAREGREAKAAAETAQRELAFYRAGMDMTDPRMSYFVKGYDGTLTSDAIKQAAQEAGFLGPQQNDNEQQQQIDTEIAAQQAFTNAAAGAGGAAQLSQDDVLAQARAAADAAPAEKRGKVFADYLATHGVTRVRMPSN